jgi:hypothetical protein
MKGLSIFMIFLLVISLTFVGAAGSSTTDVDTDSAESDRANTETDTTGEEETDTTEETKDTNTGNETSKNKTDRKRGLDRAIDASEERSEKARAVLEKLRRCQNVLDRETRIACRLKISDRVEVEDELEDEESTIPEACKNLDDRESCKKLYRAVNHCYELENRAKNKCFRRVAGFVKAKITDEQTEKGDKIRRYLNFLLYDIQERLEKKVELGTITPEQAAPIIDKITEIKEDLFNKEPKSVVKPKLRELRSMIKELKDQQANSQSTDTETT